MNSALQAIADVLRTARVILDSELLVLYCVGLQDPNLVPRSPATKAFVPDDFLALDLMLSGAREIHFTQASVAESSNHLDRKEWSRRDFLLHLRAFIGTSRELPVGSIEVAAHERFLELGFADCALGLLANSGELTVLTKDYKLAGVLRGAGKRVVNFNDFRHLWLHEARFGSRQNTPAPMK